MSDKKHIDRLFQEGFKDFEATPNNAVWERIETELNQKKKKRRVIPIWWRYAGVAAALLLLLTIGFNYFDSDKPQETIKVVNSENTPENNTNNIAEENNVENTNAANKNNIANTSQTKPNDAQTQTEAVLNTKTASTVVKASDETVITKPFNTNTKSANKTKNNSHLAQNPGLTQNKNTFKNIAKNESKSVLNNHNDSEPVVATPNNSEKPTVLIDKTQAKKLITQTNNNNITVTKTKTSNENNNTESNTKASLTIEEALENNKTTIEEEKENPKNRWSVAPNAAPVYFNTMGNGSSIDPQFNSNSKTGNINMSYGISASYAVNNKITIRSGVNRVNLGYNTNDVLVFQSAGVSNRSALQNLSINSSDALITNDASGSNTNVSFESAKAAAVIPNSFETENTSLNQSLGYIEVPLEIQYAVLNKKFGINVIGGFSSLFLNKNEIYSESTNGNSILLGEANNINSFSYSANLGLGLNYKMTNTIDLNLEPMFKYQINTFNNTSGNFTPFFIGVYTGFAIKF
ncbi:hypothetical protein LG651_03770 [Tamlana sp. 62-3]|uniref:Outer membrane protein beta-barrel domain-containing protein n=1 Tax=Neotamlana sargassicola TaxID=2883125 RepID=A0A9X1I4X1_9FLAO|nr:hypothetical protein [Tamlana sargassicola]MCB4807357.1 hypothetical protein [Tamlana sargassicola]